MRGITRADASTISRWQQDGKRYAPYRYQANNVLWSHDGNWRMPNIKEMEAMMGFPEDYTLDREGINTPQMREQLVGNSMHI